MKFWLAILAVLGTMALIVVLVVVSFWLGTLWNRSRAGDTLPAYGMMGPGMMGGSSTYGPGMMGGTWDDMPCAQGDLSYGPMGPGMMAPGGWGSQAMPCDQSTIIPGEGDVETLDDAEAAFHEYVEQLGRSGLELSEVMEFEHNYYAIVAEEDTGIGAMELLLDKASGAVGLEPGPNMMWNAKYGMHAGSGGSGHMGPGMMGRGGMGMGWDDAGDATGEMSISPERAQDLAQGWLDANLPGRTAGHADAFYGYYTLHFLNDGQIEGMLSVHGSSGDVWPHTWHGDFVAMIDGHN